MLTTLHNAHLTVSADTHGAELQSIVSANGISYLWDGDPAHWGYRAPTLFPIIGALRNDRAVSTGGPIQLPKHGFCRTADFVLTKADDTAVTYQLAADNRTRAGFPYEFLLTITHTIREASVTTQYTVCNTGDQLLPFSIGGHPAFRVPLVAGEAFEDYMVEFEQPETVDCPRLDDASGLIYSSRRNRFLSDRRAFRLNHMLFRADALLFENLRSHRVRLFSEKSGHGLEMAFDGFGFFGIWSPLRDAPFVCLEPWTGTATQDCEDDVFEHKRGMILLKSGEIHQSAYTISIF